MYKAPLNALVAAEDDIMDGHFIPKGTLVVIHPTVMHRLPEYWGDDAEEFRPSRWTESTSSKHERNTSDVDSEGSSRPFGAFMPYSLGPRFVVVFFLN